MTKKKLHTDINIKRMDDFLDDHLKVKKTVKWFSKLFINRI